MISDDDLIDEIHRLADGEKPPTQDCMNENGAYSATTYWSHFGSWNEAVNKAGYEPNNVMYIGEEELLTEIHQLADGDIPPTSTEMDQDGRYSCGTYRDNFDSWTNAIEEAGYDPTRATEIPKENLIAEIQKFADGDTPPKREELVEKGKWNVAAYRRAFGCYSDALREAGFKANADKYVTDGELLRRLAEDADGRIAPAWGDHDGHHAPRTYRTHFDTWWRGCVRAGLKPQGRRPLTPGQFEAFFEAAIDRRNPERRLVALLIQFTGLPVEYIAKLNNDWITARTGDTLVTVPPTVTKSGEEWTFKLPEIWTDDNGNTHHTTLTDLAPWYFDQYGSANVEFRTALRTCYRVASDAKLSNREFIQKSSLGMVPSVRPRDLRVTGGVRMARNGAPTHRIRRHLGLRHIDTQASVEDFFTWCEVHDSNFSHPDWDGFN